MAGQPRTPRTLVQATTDYKAAVSNGDSMVALECLQDFLYHKVGDITTGLTDDQIAQMLEIEFGFDNTKLVDAVEQAISNKENFFTQRVKDGVGSALDDINVSDSVVHGIRDSSVLLTACAEEGSSKALGKQDFQGAAQIGAINALEGFNFRLPAKTGALEALGTYDFMASAMEGAKKAIDDKRNIFRAEALSGAKSAITESSSEITGYAQSAIDNKKGVIISASEQALVNKKVSTQEEVRVAILSAYNAYALALDNARSGFEEVISRVINQTINLNDATVQYQVLLLSTSEAAERLVKTTEVFNDVVMTAERYASTITDVLAIQQLQATVLDTTKVAINSITQMRNEWAEDRKELFTTMSDVRKLQDISTKFDMAQKSIQLVLNLTERVHEGLKMKNPEIVY